MHLVTGNVEVATHIASDLSRRIDEAVARAKLDGHKALAYTHPTQAESANQWCCFLKPGVMETHPGEHFRRVVELVLDQVERFGLELNEVHVLPAAYLKRYRIMHQHYGVLASLACNALACMSDSMRCAFRQAYGVDAADVDVLGGFEFLERYGDVSPSALDLIWSNVEHCRLASGCFSGRIKVGNDTVFVINGFTPRQLATYTEPNIAIVVFMLSGDPTWAGMREDFIGRSDPALACPGSLRNALFVGRTALGIRDVSLATNGAHLSAGPVEALVELRRFTSDLTTGKRRPVTDLQFGRRLAQAFSPEGIESMLANPLVGMDGHKRSLFDLTEEMDEVTAIAFLKSVRHRIGMVS